MRGSFRVGDGGAAVPRSIRAAGGPARRPAGGTGEAAGTGRRATAVARGCDRGMTRAAFPPAYDARMDVVERIARALRVPRPVDLAIAGALAAWTLVEAVAVNGPGSTPTRIGFALLVSVPLLWRRTLPLPVLAFICAMLLLRALTADVPEYGTAPFPSMLVATYSVGAYTASAAFAVPAVLLPIATMIAATQSDFWNTDPQPGDVAILTFFVVAAWSAGRIVRHRSAQAAAARAETAARAREAVAAERARVARELHDVVAHSVSIIAVQAGAAEALMEQRPRAGPGAHRGRAAHGGRGDDRDAPPDGRAEGGRGRLRAPADPRRPRAAGRRRARDRGPGGAGARGRAAGRCPRASTSPRTASCRRR